MKILTIGSAILDIFIDRGSAKILKYDKKKFLSFQEGLKIDLNSLSFYTGGGATNSAVSFKRLGFSVDSNFKIGKDLFGEFILDKLKKEKIVIKKIFKEEKQNTGTSIIIPSPKGDRTVLVYRGANNYLDKKDLTLNENLNLISVMPLSKKSKKVLFHVLAYAKKNNIFVSINPSLDQLKDKDFKKQLKDVDIFICNMSEAEILIPSSMIKRKTSIRPMIKKILKLGPKIVVITEGEKGAYAGDNKNIYFQPIIKVKRINSLGAGDAFGSTFLAFWLSERSIKKAMLAASINAASVVSFLDAKTGLLIKKKILDRLG